MARKQNQIIGRAPVPVIIGAGITEQWYFTHLQFLRRYHIKIRPRYFGNEHIHALEKNVQQVLKNNERCIVVFDTDTMAWDEAERKRLEKFRKTYEKDPRVLLCDSLPSLEYWFLLHYENTNRHFGTSKAVIEQLVKHIPSFAKTESFLQNPRWVGEMSADNRMEQAIERADAFGTDGASYTRMPEAIRQLESERQKQEGKNNKK